MDPALSALIDMVEASYDERMIKRGLKGFVHSCGFQFFAYLQTEGLSARALSSYPEKWQKIYLRNQYSRVDPVVTEAKRRMEMFSWAIDDWPSRGSSEFKRFRDEAVEHGIRSGVTVPVQGSFGSIIMLTFASSGHKADISKCQKQLNPLQAVLAVHYRLKIIAASTIVAPGRLLSPREAMCLTWAAKGKKAWEIAFLMGITPRTVQHYFDSARKKLDAATIPQLVAIAKDRGLV
ncbi:autoinducer binding domain-containing protein [Rhizobium sp. NXC24]|uniref:autoinducer binding domain-containing protein n=1 Tax=Rhizobium sp. NXC24 TaxID=2048897 RepID=UPI000CDF396D|nr:autoinducer binding domain-containing protein [Rhizobium sp. NXC24]AVA24434.1 transcriptional activator TraR [Rhizobium sp. NXC24]